MNSFLRYIALAAVIGLLSGCGTVHVGGTTHTHIYDDMSAVDLSDPVVSAFVKFLSFAYGVASEEAEPLKGFAWNDSLVTSLEKEQKNKVKGSKDEEFEKHF
jgi:hypothetical protein